MDPVQAVILGIIQGIFEWLPVSSEAVITLTMTQLFGTAPVESINTAVYLHTGTMLAALLYFRTDFKQIIEDLPEYFNNLGQGDLQKDSLTTFLAATTIITGVIGGAIYVFGLEYLPEDPAVFSMLVGAALFVTGILKLVTTGEDRRIGSIELSDGVIAGVLQSFAIIPGISRSGSTIFGLFYRGFSSEAAFKLSFLMSVPAIIGAQIGLNLLSGFSYSTELLLASAVSFVVGYASIDAVLRIAERFEVAYLCFALGILSFLAATF